MARPRSRPIGLSLDLVEFVIWMPLVAFAHYLGWTGDQPLPVLLAACFPAVISVRPEFQRWLAGGDLRRRVSLRIFVQFVVCLTPALYIAGWGPVLTMAYVITAGMHLRWTGARAWRPAALWILVSSTLGQGAIVLGLAPNNLPTGQSTVFWILGLILSLSLLRQLGMVFEAREKADLAAEESRAATRSSERRLEALIQNSSDIISIIGADGVVKYVSNTVETELGYLASDLVGGLGDVTLDPRDAAVAKEMGALMQTRSNEVHTREMRFLHADGRVIWHAVSMRNLLHDPDIEGYVINQRDVSESRAMRESLVHDAAHDALTGLANRSRLHHILEESLAARAAARAAGSGGADEPTVAVLFIDLDGFKPVNDRFGHDSGDALLIEVAHLLERSVLGSDTVARIGGDEFAIVLGGVAGQAAAITVAQRIVRGLRRPMVLPKAEVTVGASIGIALAGDSSGASDLLRRADQAMYRAKREGRNGWSVDPAHQDAEPDHAAVGHPA